MSHNNRIRLPRIEILNRAIAENARLERRCGLLRAAIKHAIKTESIEGLADALQHDDRMAAEPLPSCRIVETD